MLSAIIIGAISGYLLHLCLLKLKQKHLADISTSIIREAELQAKSITHKAVQKAQEAQLEHEKTLCAKQLQERTQLLELQAELMKKQEMLTRDQELYNKRLETLKKSEKSASENAKRAQEQLEYTARMTQKEAEEHLKRTAQAAIQTTTDAIIQKSLREAYDTAEQKAQEILLEVLCKTDRGATADAAIELVELSSTDSKGKIIGREGRNKKALEDVLGTTFIIDSSSKTIAISSYDPYRRYKAKEVLAELQKTGKISVESIRECAVFIGKKIDQQMTLFGKEAATQVQVGNLHPEILKQLGMLRFRLSFGQNVLAHSQEVAESMGALATELKLDPIKARRIGLLHDIGKALSGTTYTLHATQGASFLSSYGEDIEVCNAVASHHGDVAAESPLAHLLKLADGLSAAKPGSRHNSKEHFFERLERLEAIALQEKGVLRAYALNGGRELQVFIQPEAVEGSATQLLIDKLKLSLEEKSHIPYPVKISIIREYDERVTSHPGK